MNKYIEVTLMFSSKKQNSYISTLEDIYGFIDSLQDGFPGDTYQLEVIEMTETEFNNLPEFTGF